MTSKNAAVAVSKEQTSVGTWLITGWNPGRNRISRGFAGNSESPDWDAFLIMSPFPPKAGNVLVAERFFHRPHPDTEASGERDSLAVLIAQQVRTVAKDDSAEEVLWDESPMTEQVWTRHR